MQTAGSSGASGGQVENGKDKEECLAEDRDIKGKGNTTDRNHVPRLMDV